MAKKMAEKEIVFVRKATGLLREVGPFSIMAIAANYAIADGIYNYTMWQSYDIPGANYPLSLLMGAGVLALAAFCIIFLTVAVPRTSSDYVAISRVIHPMVGYVETFVGLGVHFWIVGVLSYFMAWYWGSFFIQAGIATGIEGWVTFGEWLSTELWVAMVIAIVHIIIFGIANLFSIRSYKYLINILFVIPLVGSIVTAAVATKFALAGPATAKTAWDLTYGEGAWDEIIAVSDANGWSTHVADYTGDATVWGWPGKWAMGSTLTATATTAAYAFWGFDFANYVAGEVSRPRRAFLIGTLAAIGVIFVYYMFISITTLNAFGDFTSRYNFVMYGGNGADACVINPVQTPTIAVMLASLVGGTMPWASIVITITVTIWVMNGIPIYMTIPTRMVFAFSFDRFFPEKFADVNERFHTPHWAILLTIVGSLLSVIPCMFPAFAWYYAISTVTGVMLKWLFGSWAAMILPFAKPAIHEQGFTQKIAGIPLVSIFGALSTIFMTLMTFIAFGQIGIGWSIYWFVGWMAAGALLFAAYGLYNRAKGIDVEKIFSEVPPG